MSSFKPKHRRFLSKHLQATFVLFYTNESIWCLILFLLTRMREHKRNHSSQDHQTWQTESTVLKHAGTHSSIKDRTDSSPGSLDSTETGDQNKRPSSHSALERRIITLLLWFSEPDNTARKSLIIRSSQSNPTKRVLFGGERNRELVAELRTVPPFSPYTRSGADRRRKSPLPSSSSVSGNKYNDGSRYLYRFHSAASW